MDQNAGNAYLETQVMTATPQKLRLMLIEGAIRFASHTLEYWKEEKHEEAMESLVRCRGIVTELLTVIKADETEAARRTAALYLFLFQELTEAQLHRDGKKLKNAMKILEIERETWRQVCEQLPEAPDPGPAEPVEEITASNSQAIPPLPLPGASSFPSDTTDEPPIVGGGFSLEA